MDKMDSSVVGACGRAPWECMMASRSGVLYWTSFSTECTFEDVGRQKMCAVRWPAVRSAVCDRGWLFVLAVACHGKDIIRLSLKWKGQDITRQSSVPVGVYSRMMGRPDLQSAFTRTTCACGGDMS